MANDEHLKILGQGVDVWNKWRKDDLSIKPDLSGIDFHSLYRKYPILERRDSRDPNSILAPILRGINFDNTNLSYTTLRGVDLSNATLEDAYIWRANLKSCKLCNANLSGADISEANLDSANFTNANLRFVCLLITRALGTNFSGADFTGACIGDWHINSKTRLDEVKCDFFYLDALGDYIDGSLIPTIFSLGERRPRDDNIIFAPGEFAALAKKYIETLELIFVDGIDWQAFFRSFQELRDQYSNDEIAVQAIERKGQGAFIVRLETSADSETSKAIETSAKELYYRNIKQLEAQIDDYRGLLRDERLRNSQLLTIVKTMADKQVASHQTTINAQNVAAVQSGSGSITNVTQRNLTTEEKKSVAEAAKEIQDLLDQLAQTYPTTTQTEKAIFATKAIEEIEQNRTLKDRVVGALKASGMTALQEAVDNPLFNVLSAFLDGFLEQ